MRSYARLITAMQALRDECSLTAADHTINDDKTRRDAMVHGACLEEVVTILQAVRAGETYKGWIIYPYYAGGWTGEKPGVDLDDEGRVWLNPQEVRDWIDEREEDLSTDYRVPAVLRDIINAHAKAVR